MHIEIRNLQEPGPGKYACNVLQEIRLPNIEIPVALIRLEMKIHSVLMPGFRKTPTDSESVASSGANRHKIYLSPGMQLQTTATPTLSSQDLCA